MVSAWAFWRCRHIIYNYYWMGHSGGPEAPLRNSHLGPLASLGWLLKVLVGHHVGIGAAAVGTAALALFYFYRPRSRSQAASLSRVSCVPRDAWTLASARLCSLVL